MTKQEKKQLNKETTDIAKYMVEQERKGLIVVPKPEDYKTIKEWENAINDLIKMLEFQMKEKQHH